MPDRILLSDLVWDSDRLQLQLLLPDPGDECSLALPDRQDLHSVGCYHVPEGKVLSAGGVFRD